MMIFHRLRKNFIRFLGIALLINLLIPMSVSVAAEAENPIEVLVEDVPVTGLGKLKADEIQFSGSVNGVFKVAEGINPNEYMGERVNVWMNEKQEITEIAHLQPEKIVKGRLYSIFHDNKRMEPKNVVSNLKDLKKVEIRLSKDTKYRFANNAKMMWNFDLANSTKEVIKELQQLVQHSDRYSYDYRVKAVLDDKDQITFLEVIDDRLPDKTFKNGNKFGSEVIKSVDFTNLKIHTLHGPDVDLSSFEEGEKLLVFLNGEPSSLNELQPMDVYSMYYSDARKDTRLLFATRSVVKGVIDSVRYRSNSPFELQVNDKSLLLYNSSYSETKNHKVDDISYEQLRELDGKDTTLYLDASGFVRHIEVIKEQVYHGIITREVVYDPAKDMYTLIVLNENREEKEFTVSKTNLRIPERQSDREESTYIEPTHEQIVEWFRPDLNKKMLGFVEVALDDNWENPTITLLDTKKEESESLSGITWTKSVDKKKRELKVGKKRYKVADQTKVFDMTGFVVDDAVDQLENARITSFENIAADDRLIVTYLLDKGGQEVKYLFVTGCYEEIGRIENDYKGVLIKEVVYNSANKLYNLSILTEKGDKITIRSPKDKLRIPGTAKQNSKEETKYVVPTHEQILQWFRPDVYKLKLGFVHVKPNKNGKLDQIILLDTRKAEEKTLSPEEWEKASDNKDDVVKVGNSEYHVTNNTVVFDMTDDVTEGPIDKLRASTVKYKVIAGENFGRVSYLLDSEAKNVEYLFALPRERSDSLYGTVQRITKENGDETYLELEVVKDNEWQSVSYRVVDTNDDIVKFVKSGDFVYCPINVFGQVEPSKIVTIIDTHGDNPEKVEVIKADKLDDAKLDMVRTAKADEIDKNKVKYDGRWYYSYANYSTSRSDYMIQIDDLAEGDYFVMIDTADDGKAVDYIYFVTSKEDAEIMNYNMTNFLNQNN